MPNIYEYARWAASGRKNPNVDPDYSHPFLRRMQTLMIGVICLTILLCGATIAWGILRLILFYPFFDISELGELVFFVLLEGAIHLGITLAAWIVYASFAYDIWPWLKTPRDNYRFFFSRGETQPLLRRFLISSSIGTAVGFIYVVCDFFFGPLLRYERPVEMVGAMFIGGTIIFTVIHDWVYATDEESRRTQEQRQNETRGPKLSSQSDVQSHLNDLRDNRGGK